jgi:rRNA maturation endonuclease Nob1
MEIGMKALNVDDFIFDLDRVKAVINSDPKTVSIIEKLQYMINEYERQHSIEAEPVRHGRWINPHLNKYGHPCHQCNQCLFVASQKDRNFCPDCGARMDLKE